MALPTAKISLRLHSFAEGASSWWPGGQIDKDSFEWAFLNVSDAKGTSNLSMAETAGGHHLDWLTLHLPCDVRTAETSAAEEEQHEGRMPLQKAEQQWFGPRDTKAMIPICLRSERD